MRAWAAVPSRQSAVYSVHFNLTNDTLPIANQNQNIHVQASEVKV